MGLNIRISYGNSGKAPPTPLKYSCVVQATKAVLVAFSWIINFTSNRRINLGEHNFGMACLQTPVQ